MNDKAWLIQVAQAAITWEDLIYRGICGEVQIEGIDLIQAVQLEIYGMGWQREPGVERGHNFTDKIEFRAYSKAFDSGRRWLTITAGICLGAFADIDVSKTEPLHL